MAYNGLIRYECSANGSCSDMEGFVYVGWIILGWLNIVTAKLGGRLVMKKYQKD